MKNNAIILAAGLSSRFAPLSYDTPKGLLRVKDEILIERQIKQLVAGGGISEIHIVVGYKKEQFEYLKEKYGVNIIYNPDYNTKNNFASLYHARKYLKNTYILSSDNYLTINPYKSIEEYSWYMGVYTDDYTKEWVMSEDENGYINNVNIGGKNGYFMLGPAYFSDDFSKQFIKILENAYGKDEFSDYYWEDLFVKNLDILKMRIKKVSNNDIYEFDSLEELRDFDDKYKYNSENLYIKTIAKVFDVQEYQIINFKTLDKGLTNKSFYFEIDSEKYIFRIPGQGTNKFINRLDEYKIYQAIRHLNIDDNPIYFDPDSGMKIAKFITNARVANPRNDKDLDACMKLERILHNANIQVENEFDFREKIFSYEKLCREYNVDFIKDYEQTKQDIYKLINILDSMNNPKCLTHMDTLGDNFLFADEKCILIDWEYAGMCDPLAELGQFVLYAYFDKTQVDDLSFRYLQREPNNKERFRIYSYIALGGFLWYLWAMIQISNGASFYDYANKQYEYAKEFYKFAKQIKF
ncbi:NTP transferase domain-containing protein [Campylobacter sp. Cr9]|uniref:NTP transferase domain-containing protein n=1 Tax=Campylobacter sp. Cr9 TaxID=2735728 RepID=UPI0030154B9C|nr:NTP transferase domain-containing protein [Campylobacter sp. Cr9]